MKLFIILFAVIGNIMLYVLFHSRETGLCNIYCGDAINQYQNVFLFFPFILIFSLLTYKMPSVVFGVWWKFARIAIPLILIISTFINLGFHHQPGGFMNMDDMFDIPAHILLYTIFVVGSVVQIVRGLRSS